LTGSLVFSRNMAQNSCKTRKDIHDKNERGVISDHA
jgi:hypothetical protein